MNVYIQRNYPYPDLLRQTPGNSGTWKDLNFSFVNKENCDAVVVLNHPVENIEMKCRKGGRFLLIQEPPYEHNNYFKYYFRFFDTIISDFPSNGDNRMIRHQAGLPWHVNKSYDELKKLTLADIGEKKDKVSWITSNNLIFEAHRPRLDFISFLKEKQYDFDLFGRGFKPIPDKFDGIAPYRYTIAAENYISNDYWTEKIIDAYLSWTMPIYWGCTNISEYFPAESFIAVDLKKPAEALERIKEAVAKDLWKKNIEAIRHARELVLDKYQLFPMLHEIITSSKAYTETEYRNVRIPSSGLTRMEELKKKVRGFINKQK